MFTCYQYDQQKSSSFKFIDNPLAPYSWKLFQLVTLKDKILKSFPSSWWRHQIETFSALLALCEGNSPVIGEFPTQMPVTRSLDVFFDLRGNKQLSKQSWAWWFETPSRPLWRHHNVACYYTPWCYRRTNWSYPTRNKMCIWTHWSRDQIDAISQTTYLAKCIFLNEYVWILLKISLKFVPKVRINNIPAVVHILAWRLPGDKPLSEPMMDNLLTHICVTRPQWVKTESAMAFCEVSSAALYDNHDVIWWPWIYQKLIMIASKTWEKTWQTQWWQSSGPVYEVGTWRVKSQCCQQVWNWNSLPQVSMTIYF